MADLRVLVVDDEASILEVMKAFFQRRRDLCDLASNGAEALRLAQDRVYDLVLSDLSMPGMDGLELTRRVKQLQPHAICLLMSGLGTRGDMISALKIGVFDFIDKPIMELATLTMAVDRAAEAGRAMRERDALLDNLREQNSKLEYSLLRLHEAFGQLRQQEEALASDLQKAQRVQRAFLPAGFPRVPGWDFFGYYAPCDELGGDFFGAMPLPDGRLALYLVDVAGHGVSAAMITVTFRELMRAGRRSGADAGFLGDPAGVLRYLNEALLEEKFEPPILVSMVYAVIDPRSGDVHVAAAGHPPPILVAGPGRAAPIPAGGTILGTQASADYVATRSKLSEGDALLFYSDGLSELRGPDAGELSANGLIEIMRHHHAKPARSIAAELERRLRHHLQGSPSEDDVTFLVASRHRVVSAAVPAGGEIAPDSVKVVAPENPRPSRPGTRGQVHSGFGDGAFIIRLGGLITWQQAPALREVLHQARERATPPFRVDLAECEALDSTMLGLLFQQSGDVVLHQPRSRVLEQLHEMGVLHRFSISHEPCPQPKVAMAVTSAATRQACSELILSAHEALMEASEGNRQKFKEVVASLREEKAGR